MELKNTLQMPMSMYGADFKGAADKLDIRVLSGKGHGTVEEQRTALRQAARQFEAVFINQMISAMRKTVGEGGLIDKSNGQDIFEGMLDEEWSKKLANKSGPNSLSEILYRQLSARLGLDEKTINSAHSKPSGEDSVSSLRGALPIQLQRQQVRDE
tara:strand:- start:296 stop:763 length:468 start_codon:yes stop_codon:yes gene_type:complete